MESQLNYKDVEDIISLINESEGENMGAIATLFMYAIVIAVISVVAYFVIKMAVKDALKEYNNEKINK